MTKEKAIPRLVRLSAPAMISLEEKMAEINESRDKLAKKRLTKGDVVAIAVLALAIKKGIHS